MSRCTRRSCTSVISSALAASVRQAGRNEPSASTTSS
jgi:hypothetical protein